MLLHTLTFGPNHPAAHGVLRIIAYMVHEVVISTDIHLGLLHRSSERLTECRRDRLIGGYWDRMDYVSSFVQGITLESATLSTLCMLELDIPNGNTFYTVALKWHSNHGLNLGCLFGDTGGVTPLLYWFDTRELILELTELFLGSRYHN